jgi:mono/diheme cytochrome c family protein
MSLTGAAPPSGKGNGGPAARGPRAKATLLSGRRAVNNGGLAAGPERGCYAATMRSRWLLIIFGPALLMLLGSLAAMVFLPHPVPRTATPAQRLYFSSCATCHGARGDGSWRATVFLMRPGDLTDARKMDALSDEYLYTLIKNGGAALGKPGMPAFGYHLSDEQIGELIRYLRSLPRR